ncbi:MAG TPA: MFS transporter, partial [Allosphingosinicella sp.]|nr:MFS transporter [Allosphingosinicella sp.]
MSSGGSGSEGTGPGGRVLAILLLAYIFNFIDRQIIGVLAVPIREEFGLEDSALGDLGIVFGIFYATI